MMNSHPSRRPRTEEQMRQAVVCAVVCAVKPLNDMFSHLPCREVMSWLCAGIGAATDVAAARWVVL